MAARTSRRRGWAVAIALVAHVVLIALAVRSVRIVGPPPDPRAFEIRLIQLAPPPPPRPRELPHPARRVVGGRRLRGDRRGRGGRCEHDRGRDRRRI